MNTLLPPLAGAPAWFQLALDLSLQTALLSALVFLIVKTLGRWIPPAWRALLWSVVFLRLIIPVAPPSQFSLQSFFVKQQFVHVSIDQTPPTQTSTFDPLPADPIGPITSSPVKSVAAPIRIGTTLALLWSIGALIALIGILGRYAALRLSLSRATSSPAKAISELIEMCRSSMGVRYPIRLIASEEISAPALTGLLPAQLILPKRLDQFTPSQLRQIIRHELAHIKLGHLFFHWIALIARALHWFNPFVHFAAAQLRHECELAADAAALENSSPAERASYGETILAVLAQSTTPRHTLALAMAEEACHIEQRLRALNQKTPGHYRLIGALILIGVSVCGLSQATAPTAEIQKSASPAITRAPSPAQPPTDPVASQIQQARLLIELGKLDEAKALLSDTLKVDPRSPIAHSYLDLIKEQQSQRNAAKGETPDVEKTWNRIAQSSNPPQGRQRIQKLLETIRVENYRLDSKVDLIWILRDLGSEIKKRDPSGRGVNFLVAQTAGRPAVNPQTGAIDPFNELAPTPSPSPEIDVEKFQVKLDPPLHDVTLRQLLDAIVMMAKPPEGAPANARLKYSVEDYAVVFSLKLPEAPQLFTRTYHVTPAVFRQGLEGMKFTQNPFQAAVAGPGGSTTPSAAGGLFTFGDSPAQNGGGQSPAISNVTTNTTAIQDAVRAFFSAAGVNFPTNAPGASNPPQSQKAIFYNDRTGVLFVRAPREELDIVEQALHGLNARASAPPKN